MAAFYGKDGHDQVQRLQMTFYSAHKQQKDTRDENAGCYLKPKTKTIN